MINLLDFEPWWRFGVALLIGALLGMKREFIQQKEDAADFAGIRTFSLIALLGSVTAFLIVDFGILLMALSLGGLILLIVAALMMEGLHRQILKGYIYCDGFFYICGNDQPACTCA